ncbi:hypothetical protein F4777DRAFT_596986 [Nemania sp. FL0916]|nr:hypothetical protein F4777DRAFT_596986 [Nemania sp. FL0916]
MTRQFRPSNMILEADARARAEQNGYRRGVAGSTGMEEAAPAPFRPRGMSANYRGDPTVLSNQSADIPDSENTKLWITGLPRHCATTRGLMDLLQGRGKVCTSKIHPQTPPHHGAAAEVVFFRHDDAATILRAITEGSLRAPFATGTEGQANANGVGNLIDFDSINTASGFRHQVAQYQDHRRRTRGIQLSARWNRVRTTEWRPRSDLHFDQAPSRVIHLRGLPDAMQPVKLEKFFSRNFTYQLDRVINHGITKDGHLEYEYRFGSWLGQAQFAVMYIGRGELPGVTAEYGVDPCEVRRQPNILNRPTPATPSPVLNRHFPRNRRT